MLPVPDRDAAGGRVDRDPDRGEHRLGLEQAGRRGAVGEDQAVDDEVAVVHALAEVAAVAEVRFARRGELGDPVVDPLPDEPAVQAGVPVEELGVVGQAAPARCPWRGRIRTASWAGGGGARRVRGSR